MILEALFKAVADKKISKKTFELIVENSEYQHWLDTWEFNDDYDY